MTEIKGIVFDIGRVLINWDPKGCYDRWIGEERRRKLFDEVPLEATNLEIDRGADFRPIIAALADQYPEWRDEIMFWHDRWSDMASPAIDRSVSLLDQLLAGSRPVYALTNFGRKTFEIATVMYPFLTRFKTAFVSGHLRQIKPDAAIYEALEEGTGLSGAELFFTDDSPANIDAAAARGWHTHLFKDPDGLENKLRDLELLS